MTRFYRFDRNGGPADFFDEAGKKHTQTLVDDVPNFSSVMPTAFATKIYGIGSS